MNTKPDNEKYYTTAQAAKILSVSITTVQRMVENGLFKAYVTEGGHRRIWASSLSLYSKKIGAAVTDEAVDALQVCVLHSSQHIQEELVKISHLPHVTVITDPLDLMGMSKLAACFFVDLRIPWLVQSPLNLQNHASANASIMAYNAAGLAKTSPWRKNPNLTLLEQDISENFVRGYMLSTAHRNREQTPTH